MGSKESGVQDGVSCEREPSQRDLVRKNLRFIPRVGFDKIRFTFLNISACCCARHRLWRHTSGSRNTE